MNPITSYIRHVITALILVLVNRLIDLSGLNIPTEGLQEAVEFIVEAIVFTGTWYFVKYISPFLKK